MSDIHHKNSAIAELAAQCCTSRNFAFLFFNQIKPNWPLTMQTSRQYNSCKKTYKTINTVQEIQIQNKTCQYDHWKSTNSSGSRGHHYVIY